MNIFKNKKYWKIGIVIGFLVGLYIGLSMAVALSGSLPHNLRGWGELLLMICMFGWIYYLPGAIVGALVGLFADFLKSKGLLSRYVAYLGIIIGVLILFLGIAFVINPDLMMALK